MPKVTVAIAAYNNAKFLPEVLDSILSQTYKDFEIIVVDDASTDATPQIAERYKDKIIYLKQEQNKGSAAAWNRAFQEAKGEYIVLAASDDTWLPERLEEQVKVLDAKQNIGIVYCHCVTTDEKGDVIRDKDESEKLPFGRVLKDLFMTSNFMPASTVIFRKSLLKKSGMLDEELRLCQDYDLYMRLARHTETAFINKILIKYRRHLGSVSTDKRYKAFEYQRKVIDKIWNKFKDDEEAGINNKMYYKRLFKQAVKEGRYYLRHGKPDLAREKLKEALKYRPFSISILFNYLRTLIHV